MTSKEEVSLPKAIEESGWQAVIDAVHELTCSALRQPFLDAARRKESEGSGAEAKFLSLLGDVSSYALHFGPDSAANPYGPIATWSDGSRTALPSDLTDQQLDTLEVFVSELESGELRARILDVLFLRGRGFQHAPRAVQAYLDAASSFRSQENWIGAVRWQERAVRLAGSIRNGNVGLFETAIRSTEAILAEYDDVADICMVAKTLMELLLEFDQGDPNRYRRHCEVLARLREGRSHWDQAREYWELASQWDRKAGGMNSARLAATGAETYVQAANVALSGAQIPNTLAAGSVADAVHAFRQIGNRERADELHRWLLDLQRAARDEMTSIDLLEMDFTPYAAAAQASVDGKSLEEAIDALVFVIELISKSEIQEIVEKQIEAAPLISRIGTAAVNREGQTVAERGALIVDGADEQTSAIEAEILVQARIFRGGQVLGQIDPARSKVAEQHETGEEALLSYVRASPFVAEDRAPLVAQGLAAGFRGDWPTACSLLVPQLEECVRMLLRGLGEIASTLDSRSVQKQQDLNTLLFSDRLAEFLGDDVVFHLQGLLVKDHGGNVRNRMAHGLMNDEDFRDPDVRFVWWIVLCLCWPNLWKRKTP